VHATGLRATPHFNAYGVHNILGTILELTESMIVLHARALRNANELMTLLLVLAFPRAYFEQIMLGLLPLPFRYENATSPGLHSLCMQ